MKRSKKFRKRSSLDNLAKALDRCEQAGLKPRLAHGMVFTSVGYVLPPMKKKDRWIVRLALRSPYEDSEYDVHLSI